MKRLLFLPLFLTALVACTQNNRRSKNDALVEPQAAEGKDTLCFQRYSGLTRQDTASVKLIFNGDTVTGQYTNLPYEKDGRFGTITGIKRGQLITGIWHYQQEGINDSLAFEFKLQDTRLLQKGTSLDRSTGREFLSDTASFNLAFVKVDCMTAHFAAGETRSFLSFQLVLNSF